MSKLAGDLLRQAGLRRPFRKLELLASFQDIVRIDTIVMPDAGRLVPTADGLVVQVNAADSRGKRRFTTCHEIGHTLIPSYWDGPPLRSDGSTGQYGVDREEEYLCDLAAAELLMPTDEFRRELAWHKLHVWSIERLAIEFGTSLEAAAIKCAQCSNSRVAVIVWESATLQDRRSRHMPSTGPLRIRFACSSGGFEGHVFPKGATIPAGSLAHRVYTQDGWIEGEDELPTADGLVPFYTESQVFKYPVGSGWERKVITLAFPSRV